jgi:transcriptional regulator with XRE-family HTH domain
MNSNVRHMHIPVKPECAWRRIGFQHDSRDTLRMTHIRQPHYIRAWRKHVGKTLVQVAEELHMTHGQLSKIERGAQSYNQELLERLADLFGCAAADLLIRDPSQPEHIWSLWDRAQPGERVQITAVAEALMTKANRAA